MRDSLIWNVPVPPPSASITSPAATITSPYGTQPPYSGTGYIGNKSGLSRAWNGSIDDPRIYNRLLSDAEVKAIASLPPANLAPVVRAGTKAGRAGGPRQPGHDLRGNLVR